MLKRLAIISLIILTGTVQLHGQGIATDFKPVADSLTTLLKERTTVYSRLTIQKVLKRDGALDFYFNQNLADFHWSRDDVAWFKKELKSQFPAAYKTYSIGNIYSRTIPIGELITPDISNNGKASAYKYAGKDPAKGRTPFITQVGGQKFSKGMSGRHIALWQSHGRYFEAKTRRWEWQRAPCHRTVEDMYTQSYVLPFLIPMLENAGAYVLTPRERDTQPYEVITDNDEAFAGERTGLLRRKGVYSEKGRWSDAGAGFADACETYLMTQNPFTMGTVRQAECVLEAKDRKAASATWTADIPERGEYAVYISYASLPNSSDCAHYTVRHMGGESEFIVNQKIGGSTWIYLGTFEFAQGNDACVTLDNVIPTGHSLRKGSVVTADAVKIGGGMGKVIRGTEADEKWTTSGMPAFCEGALYWMQWAGTDTTITNKFGDDYTNDYGTRGPWTGMMLEKGIPFDLSLGFHTDAGTTLDDSTIGTLSIYTLNCEGSRKLPDGRDRMLGRHLAGAVQDQICDDVRADFDPDWNKRFLWDRSYSESRTTSVPGMLLELLSHQNFADMKYGLDPAFRFTVSRAIYKGMLKFLSDSYGVPYVVQPLPVSSFSADLGEGNVTLAWKETVDEKEPTAKAGGFILQTRVDDGAFDQGIILKDVHEQDGIFSANVGIEAGHVYSFKLTAFNDGGRSFPSEVLCVAMPTGEAAGTLLVVNNFDRVAAPTWFDTPEYAGFDGRTDGGVAWGHEINYIGENYQFRRSLPWMDDDNPGFGASYSDIAGKLIPGNTFDFVYSHAAAALEAGYAVSSASRDAFTAGTSHAKPFAVDILCGKQVTTKIGRGAVPARFSVFPVELQQAIKDATADGQHILISGAHIGTDVWDEIYPVQLDSAYRADTREFVQNVLGYKWLTDHGCYTGSIAPVSNQLCNFTGGAFAFHQSLNDQIYCVETPDGILPANDNGEILLRYTGNDVSAAVGYNAGGYKVISMGFPIECVCEPQARTAIIREALEFFRK